jgi:D-3-phosphoglycerate dehydrogenase / 2-oxoglutarate reductase
MAFNVLINDGMECEGMEMFEREGISFLNKHYQGLELLEEIGGFDALLVRSKTKVSDEIISAGVRDGGLLRMIGRGGVGVDNIDLNAANKYGVVVKFAPNGVTNSTAEQAIALMFAVARKIPQSNHFLREGTWRKKAFSGTELEGKTVGIIGCGRIGQSVATKARALGMEVIGYDAYMDSAKEKFPDSTIKYLSKEDVLSVADIVSLHTGGKEIVIGRNELRQMKPCAILINVSRGNNVDEEALYDYLSEGRLHGAGLDTYVSEPKSEGEGVTSSMSQLSSLENVVMTPHLGASTSEGQRKTSIELARVTIDYLLNGDYKNSVNTKKPSDEGKPVYTFCVHHTDVPNMFAQMTNLLGRYQINIRDVHSEKIGSDGEVVTNYVVHQPVNNNLLSEIRKIDGVYRALFTRR